MPSDPPSICPCDTILEANLFDALALAVRTLRETEARISPTFCSAFRAGLEANLAAMRAGGGLRVIR